MLMVYVWLTLVCTKKFSSSAASISSVFVSIALALYCLCVWRSDYLLCADYMLSSLGLIVNVMAMPMPRLTLIRGQTFGVENNFLSTFFNVPFLQLAADCSFKNHPLPISNNVLNKPTSYFFVCAPCWLLN